MDPVLFLCVPMVITLIVALIFVVQRSMQELKNESLPLAARRSLTLGGIDFAITSLDHESFTERAAIYAILVARPDASFEIIDAGDTTELGSKPINTPERQVSWLRRNPDIWVGVHLLTSDDDTPKERDAIVRDLLNQVA